MAAVAVVAAVAVGSPDLAAAAAAEVVVGRIAAAAVQKGWGRTRGRRPGRCWPTNTCGNC